MTSFRSFLRSALNYHDRMDLILLFQLYVNLLLFVCSSMFYKVFIAYFEIFLMVLIHMDNKFDEFLMTLFPVKAQLALSEYFRKLPCFEKMFISMEQFTAKFDAFRNFRAFRGYVPRALLAKNEEVAVKEKVTLLRKLKNLFGGGNRAAALAATAGTTTTIAGAKTNEIEALFSRGLTLEALQYNISTVLECFTPKTVLQELANLTNIDKLAWSLLIFVYLRKALFKNITGFTEIIGVFLRTFQVFDDFNVFLFAFVPTLIPTAYGARKLLHELNMVRDDEYKIDIANGEYVIFHFFLAFLFEASFFCILDSAIVYAMTLKIHMEDWVLERSDVTFYDHPDHPNDPDQGKEGSLPPHGKEGEDEEKIEYDNEAENNDEVG